MPGPAGRTDARKALILGSAALAAAVWVETWLQTPAFSVSGSAFRIRPLPLFLLGAAFMLLLAGTVRLLAKRKIEAAPDFFPFGFLFFSPVAASRFLTRDDLRLRLALLAGFVVLAALVLVRSRIRRAGSSSLRASWPVRFERLSPARRIIFLFLAAWIIYGALAFLLVSEDISFYGDEPHYLMISQSLLKDGDIDLADNFAARDYFHFYEEKKDPHLRLNPHGQRGQADPDAIYPINMPGISVLMLPAYALSFLFKGALLTWILKSSLAVWAALLGVQFYLLARRFWGPGGPALGLWALYAFTSPVLFFSVHLYPELPVAFMALLIFRKTYAAERLPRTQAVLFGLLLGLFPWFGLKYLFLLGPLLVVAVVSSWAWQKARVNAILLLGLSLLGVALYFLFIHHLYGTWSPTAVYKGTLSAERASALGRDYLDIPLSMRLDTLAGYFLDQRDGLLPSAPIYFFALPGFLVLLRRRARDLGVLLFVGGPYVGALAFLTERGGFSPPARPLAAVSWILMLGVGAFIADKRKPAWTTAWKSAAALALAMAAVLALHPFYLYQPTTRDTPVRPADAFVLLGHLGFFPPSFLPSYIKYPNGGQTPNAVWAALLLLAAAVYFAGRPQKSAIPGTPARTAAASAALLAAVWLWVLFPRPVLYNQRTVRFDQGQALSFPLFPAGRGVVFQPPGNLYLHYEKSYRLYFQSARPLQRLEIVCGSAAGDFDVRIDLFDRPIFEGRLDQVLKTLIVPRPEHYAKGRFPLYVLRVSLRHRSPENMMDRPFLVGIRPPAR